MRSFNTSGPNILAQHYTLPRLHLVEQGKDLVHNNRYFTIWAPRQTGKSTFFRLLARSLQEEGYLVCYVGFENYLVSSFSAFMNRLVPGLEEAWHLDLKNLELADVFYTIEQVKDNKLVLIIDEVEGINPEYFGQFLHTIKDGILPSKKRP